MKYCFVVLLFSYAALAAPSNEENIQAAQFQSFYPYNNFYQQQSMFNMPIDESMNFASPEIYLSMKNEDFPVDYSLACSNTCGCRQACAVMWWMPCTCRCPPLCGCVGCVWGCCGNVCCEDIPRTTPTTTTEQDEPPPPPPLPPLPPPGDDDDDEVDTTTDRNCNNGCCNCSCQPCMIWWMCPRPCGSSCCGRSNNCCNGSNNSCCGK